MTLSLSLLLLLAAPQQDKTRDELEKLKEEVRQLKLRLDKDEEKVADLQGLPAFLQRFQLQLYSNVTGRFDDRSRVRNSSAMGQVNLFVQADLGEGLTVLNENVLVTSTANAQTATIQRVYAKYKYDDWLSFKFGREHTPFGYWNYEFHHGSYLQTPVERPLMWTFESSGGVMPTHYVGPEVSGIVDWLGGWNYMVYAANGRGRVSTEVQNVTDANEEKAFGARLEYLGLAEHLGLPELRLGASAYFDTVTAGAAKVKFEELILGAHFVLSWGDLTVAAEGFMMSHDDEDLSDERRFQGGYAMASYEFPKCNLTPYVLGERMNFDSSDPLLGTQKDVNQIRLGVRWDFHSNAAIKVEYDRQFLREMHDVDVFLIDVSFGI